MPAALLVALALLGPVEARSPAPAPAPAPADPGAVRRPLALLLGMEVDDLDRDLKRQHDAVSASRQRLATAQRLAQRGVATADSVEQEAADARFQGAREAEMLAVRVLKAHQRDVLSGTAPADEAKEYALVLDVLKSQQATARTEAEFRAYRLRQAQGLLARGVISKVERDAAELEANAARASVALLGARQAQLALDHARRAGARPADVSRLEAAHLRTRVDHEALAATVAHARIDLIRARARLASPAPSELDALQKAADEADATLAADRRRLAELPPAPPAPDPSPP